MSRKLLGLLVGGLMLVAAAPAGAATVDVQIEGQTHVRAPITVQTPAGVNRAGFGSCPGASAIGALDVAVGGQWAGQTYGVDDILGEQHTFGSGSFWAIYLNGSYQNSGACEIAVKDGDEVLFYWADDTFTPGVGGYDEPLLLTAPKTLRPGEAFTVTVREATTTFDASFAGTTAFAPSAGALVSAGGSTAFTAADGTAALLVPDAGPIQITAQKGNRAPDRVSACATTGADGQCGTTAPPPPPAPAPDTKAAYGFVTSVTEGKAYAKGKGPRELEGRVDQEPSGIADVRLRLTRNDNGRCATLDARREAFKTIKRCGAVRGTWFSVGDKAEWSYLLPARLPRGRYVLDVLVVDKAGNKDDQLARGRNRVVFTVA